MSSFSCAPPGHSVHLQAYISTPPRLLKSTLFVNSPLPCFLPRNYILEIHCHGIKFYLILFNGTSSSILFFLIVHQVLPYSFMDVEQFFCCCYIGVEFINNVVLVSRVQQSDSVIQIHVCILFQILFPFRLLQSIEQSFLCCTVGPSWLSILNIAVCTCQSQTPNLCLPPTLAPGNHKFLL